MISKKLFSALLATLVILSILGASSVAFAQVPTDRDDQRANTTATNATKNATMNATKNATTNATKNVTKGVVASAAASAAGGFLGLPGFEALYAVAGLLAVAYLVMRRRK
jgi:PGF-CTERM protein